jgi:hypothetical protein
VISLFPQISNISIAGNAKQNMPFNKLYKGHRRCKILHILQRECMQNNQNRIDNVISIYNYSNEGGTICLTGLVKQLSSEQHNATTILNV